MIRIAPSVLAADFSRLSDQIAQAEAGGADWIHLDVMDGHFVPNITFGPLVVAAIRSCTNLPLDTHLMVQAPENFVGRFRDAGSDYLTVHQEACTHLHRTVERIKELGAKAGVAINPATPCSVIKDVLGDIDLILIMSVNPGFGGQAFIPATLRRLAEARRMITESGRDICLEVDGGIDTITAPQVVKSGADVLVAGTSVFRQPDVAGAISALRESFEKQ